MTKDINELSNKSVQSIINDKEVKDDNGEYIGQIVNGLKNGKGIIIIIMVINMKVNGKMIKGKEKVLFIIIMVINMKVNGKIM